MSALKESGNALFRQGDYLRAAAAYSKALKQDPSSAVLHSNRSAALLRLNKLAKALADAEECVRLDPAWERGWMRKAMVLEALGQLGAAAECYRAAHKAAGGDCPEYAAKAKALATALKAEQAKARQSPEEAAALAFAASKLAYALELIAAAAADGGNNSKSFPAELHFQHAADKKKPSSKKKSSSCDAAAGGGGAEPSALAASDYADQQPPRETAVRAPHAFDSPMMLEEFVTAMRVTAKEQGASAAVLIVPKQAVAFPQCWLQNTWPFNRDRDGVFVQLQAVIPAAPAQDTAAAPDTAAAADADATVTLRKGSDGSKAGQASTADSSSNAPRTVQRVWFISTSANKPPSEPEELDEKFALLPKILKISSH